MGKRLHELKTCIENNDIKKTKEISHQLGQMGAFDDALLAITISFHFINVRSSVNFHILNKFYIFYKNFITCPIHVKLT